MTGTITRRDAMARLMALGVALPMASRATALPGARAAQPAATPVSGGGALAHRGINYDVGTRVSPDFTTRPDAHRAFLQSEMEAIRDELHCTSVGIFGEDVDRLIEGATAALNAGLNVRVQPRLVDASPDQMLLTLAEVAQAVEPLRAAGESDVVLDVGCELTLLGGGIIPGATFAERFDYFLHHLDELPDFNEALGELLGQAVAEARSSFGGRLTYASGAWEAVDWTEFDIVSVDLYRDATNQDNYLELLRSYLTFDKPVWITEFGCCSYEGADERGGSGFDIVDWTANPPQIVEEVTRSEAVQADYIGELLDIFEREGVDGAFVYQFIEPAYTHDPDEPRFDLDMASYGVVKTYGAETENPYETTGYWEPKEAFGAIATRYGGGTPSLSATPLA